MPRFNIKEDGVVVNTINADLEFVQSMDQEFEEVVEEEVIEEVFFTKLEFLELFTDEELEDFLDIDNLPPPAQRPMRVVIKKFDAVTRVSMTDPVTIKLIAGLVTLGIVTQARADEILAATK